MKFDYNFSRTDRAQVLKLTLIVLLGIIANCAGAQDSQFSYKASTPQQMHEANTQPAGSITVDGKTFDVFQTATGSKYVRAIGASGKPYQRWIGEPTGLTFDGREVRQFSSGSYAVFKLAKTGYPYPVYIERN